jgi:hypothetical protein
MSTSRNLVRIALLAALMLGLCWTFFARPSHGATEPDRQRLVPAGSCRLYTLSSHGREVTRMGWGLREVAAVPFRQQASRASRR